MDHPKIYYYRFKREFHRWAVDNSDKFNDWMMRTFKRNPKLQALEAYQDRYGSRGLHKKFSPHFNLKEP